MRMLVFGAKGYLGRKFLEVFPEAIPSDADIADGEAVRAALDAATPEVVINAAGKTGSPNVDWCEDHKIETLRSNTLGPLVLLEECGKRGIYWVHLSTGCIYEGGTERAFTEDDPPNFRGSFYSLTKGWTDQILLEAGKRPEFLTRPDQRGGVLQLRLRMPFDDFPSPRNLITKLVKYPRVLDAENSLTYVPDFLNTAKTLIERRAKGTYNVVNPGAISPFRIMELYREIVDPAHHFECLTLRELPGAVKAGRSNCVLSSTKLEREGIKLQPVEEAVRRALGAYAVREVLTP